MLLPVEPGVGEGRLYQLANRVHLSRPDHEIVWALRLKDLPHTLHVLRSVAPVPPRLKIAEEYFVGALGHNGRDTACDLPADEDRKSTRLNSSHQIISYAVSLLK